MRTVPISVFLSLFLAAMPALAQTPADRIITEALKPSSLQSNLERLTDQIGGRVPGTPAMQRAVDWGVAAFQAAGADSVHTENFTIPASWEEGATSMAVVAPESFTVRAVSIAWAPALEPQHHVRVVDVAEGTAQDFARAGNLTGVIALVHSPEMRTWDDLFAEYMNAIRVVQQAVRAKVLAVAFQSSRPRDLLYRHTNSAGGEIDRLPMLLVAREDANRISRLLASGQQLYADLAIPNRIGGPIQAANVVAEIKGSEKPDEFVVLGAHLDSWELGTGALDNGCNAALVIDALRAIKASGLRPRRSIRFILFSGEEEGMVGSHAYADAHRGEMDNADAALIFDAGTGKVTGFSLGGRNDVLTPVNALAAPLRQFGAATMTTDAMYGTDHFDFLLQGVPTLVANQDAANYLINYHAMSDTYDKVDFPQLKKHVAEAAELSFAIADAPNRLGPRLDRQQISKTLSGTHLDDEMKGFGVWDGWASGQRGRQ